MKATAISNYIRLGAKARYLLDAGEGFPVFGETYILDNIKTYFELLDSYELKVTYRASYNLKEFQDTLMEKSEDSTLTAIEAIELRRIMGKIRPTLYAESMGIFAYVVTDKRLDVNKLLDGVDKLFAPNVYDEMPEIARYDFKEAGLCIAFERPTSAAFHILRATEAILRKYYKRYIRKAEKVLTWGGMTHALINKKSGKKPEPVLLDNLDNMRKSFRNPTQHPDKIYEIHEAQDLLGLSVDAVNKMMAVIMK